MNTNTPSPLVPQGALPEGRNKSRTRIVVFTILAVHVVFVCVLLLQGCKRTTDDPLAGGELTTNLPPIQPVEPLPLAITPTNPPPFTVAHQQPVTVVTQQPPPPPPDSTTTTTPPPTGETKDHKVEKGDSFYTMAKKYGVTMKAISEANPGVDSTRLKIGQVIKIPPPAPKSGAPTAAASGESSEKVYVVKSNDNLGKIAKAHGVTVKALRAANNLKTDRITVGQKLKIPARSTAPTEARPPTEGVIPQ
jgi:LysM repeat protein